MNRETLNTIVTIIALIPMSFFMFLSIFMIRNIILNIQPNDFPILTSLLLGILGYIGLLWNLIYDKKKVAETLNFILLVLGILGFILFVSIEGGFKGWRWIFTIEEPEEWFIIVGPIIITIYLMIEKVKRLFRLYKGSIIEK